MEFKIKEIIDGKGPPSGEQEIKQESSNSSKKKSQSNIDEDSGDVMGGTLPDPHPA